MRPPVPECEYCGPETPEGSRDLCDVHREVLSCSVCGVSLDSWTDPVWNASAEGEDLTAATVLCRECATDLDEIGETMTEKDSPETPAPLPADAPPGDTYGSQQAAQVLGVSPRRVSQLAQEGRLSVVQEKPLRVSAQSVHDLRAERAGKGKHPLAAPPPESVADQVERLVALVTAEQRKAIEAGETLLSEVSRQRDEIRTERDEMRSEVERLRAENERLREESQKPRKWWGGRS